MLLQRTWRCSTKSTSFILVSNSNAPFLMRSAVAASYGTTRRPPPRRLEEEAVGLPRACCWMPSGTILGELSPMRPPAARPVLTREQRGHSEWHWCCDIHRYALTWHTLDGGATLLAHAHGVWTGHRQAASRCTGRSAGCAPLPSPASVGFPQAVVLRCPARAASSDCYAEFEDKPLTPTRICIPHSPGAAESHQLDFSADAHYMQLLGTAYYISCAKTC